VGWGYYFTEFNHWMPGGVAGFMEDIPTCCLSMKREVYEQHGPFIEGTYCSDTVFNWRVTEAGYQPYFDPAIQVDHLNPTRFLETLLHEPMHGRSFANVRAREKHLSRGRLLTYSLFAPLLPPLLYARAAGRALKSPGTFPRFLATTPVALSAMTAWSLGEFMGYLSHAFRRGPS
jgi:GT2 family glycosyltransferase